MSHDPRIPAFASVLDRQVLAALFDSLAGRTLLGAVDCLDCVELVFTLDGDGHGLNLVTLYTEDVRAGTSSLASSPSPWSTSTSRGARHPRRPPGWAIPTPSSHAPICASSDRSGAPSTRCFRRSTSSCCPATPAR